MPDHEDRKQRLPSNGLRGRDHDAGITELVLAGVFIDGCVGLTAADAAQRGFDVTFVEDAIGHTRLDRRAVILNWIAEDYELNVVRTDQLIARLSKRPY